MKQPQFNRICLYAAVCSLLMLTGCYRMPNEGEFSLVPTTNNPAVTCEKQSPTIIPGVGY
jgi:hypothetical protein